MRRFIYQLVAGILLTHCFACQNIQPTRNQIDDSGFPRVILWAWERPENLEFADPNKYGVAFLAQTLELKADEVVFKPRRQPLKVAKGAKIIAVTRIEAQKTTGSSPSLSAVQRGKIVEFVVKTLALPDVAAIQIDFDAAVSEREFYRALLGDLQAKLPENVPLTITALASFCIGDRWFRDLPVAEAVPMIFRMGADAGNIRNFLANGNDFNEPLCQRSYGIATDEPFEINYRPNRRLYVFNERAWRESDLARLPKEFQP